MKIRTAIVALVASNAAFAAVVVYQAIALQRSDDVYGDHVQQLRMDVPNQVLRVQLGKSETAGGPAVIDPEPTGTIVLTPRAAIQLDVELRRMFSLIQDAATAEARREELLSPDRSL